MGWDSCLLAITCKSGLAGNSAAQRSPRRPEGLPLSLLLSAQTQGSGWRRLRVQLCPGRLLARPEGPTTAQGLWGPLPCRVFPPSACPQPRRPLQLARSVLTTSAVGHPHHTEVTTRESLGSRASAQRPLRAEAGVEQPQRASPSHAWPSGHAVTLRGSHARLTSRGRLQG